jgi:hypothetical protein
MQIGDCNTPATFQHVMTMIFQDFIGIFLHVYLDDLFIYSKNTEEHKKHLRQIFEKIREHKFYLCEEKCELYAEVVDCLGHKINKRGLHADADKIVQIRDWQKPHMYNDMQKFVGLIQYLAPFLPDITSYTGPLTSICQNRDPFIWQPIHNKCFEMIKHVCCTTAML